MTAAATPGTGLLERRRFFVDGGWAEPHGDDVQRAIEAATGELLGEAALGTPQDIDAAVRRPAGHSTRGRGAARPPRSGPRRCAGSPTPSRPVERRRASW